MWVCECGCVYGAGTYLLLSIGVRMIRILTLRHTHTEMRIFSHGIKNKWVTTRKREAT